jgi:hypothetical protein
MSGTVKLPHECPKCGKTATIHEELDRLFGYRNMSKGVSNQSWCKECRKKS